MYTNGTDGATAAVFLLFSLVISWLVIYTAVAAGVGHALDRVKPRLLAEVHTTEQGVRFVVSNLGTGSAFDVTARWSNAPTGEVLARTRLLGPNGRLEWTLAAAPIPDELQSIRTLTVDWANGIDPAAGRQFKLLAVLVPSQLGAAR
ncbi:MAG TPA: hypothetical protein VIK06_03655 [Candidatus Limnocylindrales bacterium]